jgi:hypothetical protein
MQGTVGGLNTGDSGWTECRGLLIGHSWSIEQLHEVKT